MEQQTKTTEKKDFWPIVTSFWPDQYKDGNFYSKPLTDAFKDGPTGFEILMKSITENSSLYLQKGTASNGNEYFRLCVRPPLEKNAERIARSKTKRTVSDGPVNEDESGDLV